MKSFLLSFTIVVGICFFFMSIFDNKINEVYRKIPDWIFILLFICCIIGLLLALYRGITGMMKGQRMLNITGIFCSIFGIGIFITGYMMDSGRGKESKGQFDHELNLVEINQRIALYNLMKQTNTSAGEVQLVPYWKLHGNPGKFVACVQKGNVIGLQIHSPLNDLENINALNRLNLLNLDSCQLQSIAGLQLPSLQKLSIKNNQLTSLNGIENFRDLKWFDYSGNPLKDSSALRSLADKELF